jgi:hypothetical protein
MEFSLRLVHSKLEGTESDAQRRLGRNGWRAGLPDSSAPSGASE